MKDLLIYSIFVGIGIFILIVIDKFTGIFTRIFTRMFKGTFIETFTGMFTGMCSSLMNAHGSEPAGFGAFPGKVEQRQNKEASHVNPMYRNGNPQNVFPEFKLQPK